MTGRAGRWVGVAATVVAMVTSCKDPVAPPALTVVSGNDQSAPTRALLPQPLVVRVANLPSGEKAWLQWRVTAGGGKLTVPSFAFPETDLHGYGSVVWLLGPTAGTQTVEVSALDPAGIARPSDPVTFTATATAAQTGLRWSAQPTGTSNSLYDVWGSSPTDVFAVGDSGAILHYDGTAWRRQATGGLDIFYAVWGTSATDVYAVGHLGVIRHYDGTGWALQTSGTRQALRGVWGTGPSNVFAVGEGGTVLHYDGAEWRPEASSTSATLSDVWGVAPNNVFAVGNGGNIIHNDGNRWAVVQSPGTQPALSSISGVSSTAVFAVGLSEVFGITTGYVFHHDGSTWRPLIAGPIAGLQDVWASSGADLFAVGDEGSIIHHDGNWWRLEDSGINSVLHGVWGSSSSDVFAVGRSGVILHGIP